MAKANRRTMSHNISKIIFLSDSTFHRHISKLDNTRKLCVRVLNYVIER